MFILLAQYPWIAKYRYLGLIVAMLIEGPGATVLGAFLARVGYLNIWLVLLISVLGNFIPDVVFYLIGFWAHTGFIGRLIDKHGHRIGLSKERIGKMGKLYQEHPFQTILFVKMMPLVVPFIGLASAGASRMPIKKYLTWVMVITIIIFGSFLGIGYYLGDIYFRLSSYPGFVAYQGIALVGIALMAIAIIHGYKKLKALWVKKKASKLNEIYSEIEK